MKENDSNPCGGEVLRQLTERKSVRVFEERPIPESAVTAIVQAAMNAPTAGNQQLYTILNITDQALKDTLAETCDGQPFIAKAPLVLIFCADCCKWYDAYREAGCAPRRPDVGDLLLAEADTVAAAQNAVTAAWSLGIGSCYIGDILERCEEHRVLLRLPPYVLPAAMVVFGYPTEQQLRRPKPARFAAKDMVCENVYRRKSGAELRKMFKKNCAPQEFDTWVRRFCERKYNSDFSVEMSRSVRQYLRDFSDEQPEQP